MSAQPRDYLVAATEAQVQAAITDTVDALGGRWAHIRDSRGQPAEGLPDLIISLPPVLALIECKNMKRKATPLQQVWLHDLGRCWRVESGLVRPYLPDPPIDGDLRTYALDDLLDELARWASLGES